MMGCGRISIFGFSKPPSPVIRESHFLEKKETTFSRLLDLLLQQPQYAIIRKTMHQITFQFPLYQCFVVFVIIYSKYYLAKARCCLRRIRHEISQRNHFTATHSNRKRQTKTSSLGFFFESFVRLHSTFFSQLQLHCKPYLLLYLLLSTKGRLGEMQN